ncbi:MAG: type II/IV secretion system ATPase subunit [Candidatus Nezhaarchaeota archaeon]|nr:type II/IV secretion system ATPase subunit [Candidatus Nezhaarchaeota archaeon]
MRLSLKPRLRRLSPTKKNPDPLLHVNLISSHVDPGELSTLELVETYSVGSHVKVILGAKAGTGYYFVEEPRLSHADLVCYGALMQALKVMIKPSPLMLSDPAGYLESYVEKVSDEYGLSSLSKEVKEKILYYIKRDTLGYGPLDPLIRDPKIEDISIEGVSRPVRVFHRTFNDLDWLITNISFHDEQSIDHIVVKLVHTAGKHVSTAFPIADIALPEKHRVTVTYSREVTPFGSSVTIRKFREEPLTICHLIAWRTVSPLMAAYWWLLLEHKMFIMIVGPMASGKTTLLNALATLLKPNWKVVSIEDNQELHLPHVGWKPLVARHTYTLGESKTEIELFDLVKLSLRERADFIIVGEVRGEEAYALVQAAASGHGCACTFHGDSFETMVQRLTSPPINVSPSFIPLITNVVIVKRVAPLGNKPARRVVKVSEVVNVKEERELFRWDPQLDVHLPLSVEELIERSLVLNKIAGLSEWSLSQLKEEVKRRASFLKSLVKDNVLSYSDVVAKLRNFYAEAY